MSNPYIGEIRMFAGNFAPAGWQFCDGTKLPIAGNEALYNLIGTSFGGDGISTFGVPDLRGRIAIHQGQGPGITQNYVIGQMSGIEQVTLTISQLPSHNHPLFASSATATNQSPNNTILAASPTISPYLLDVAGAQLSTKAMQSIGSDQPHDNMMPFLCINFILSLNGIFPSQT